MRSVSLAVLAALLAAGPAAAQMGDMPGMAANPGPTIAPPPTAAELKLPRPARARGIPGALAAEGALTAISTCLGNGYKVTGLVTDTAGVPIAMISGDGAAAITQRIAMTKAQAVLKYKMTSGEVAAKAAADKSFAAEVKADPMIETARQGAIPIMIGSEMVGAFAVSGAPGGDKDEPCAKAGLAKIAARLR
jgi:uncharacterized protein GlcG (DUF336 family)